MKLPRSAFACPMAKVIFHLIPPEEFFKTQSHLQCLMKAVRIGFSFKPWASPILKG